MKLKKWIIGIITVIALLAAVVFVIKHYKDRNYIIEKYPETALLLSFIEQSKNDTVVVSDFSDLYRSLFLSKINDSTISFCSLLDAEGHQYMLIISPDSISIFESPDLNANMTMLGLTIDHEGYTKETNLMFRKIERELDLIFKQEKIRSYRFIGFSKKKSNRAIFIDNFNDNFRSGGLCYTHTVKNCIFNPQKLKFINDRCDIQDRTWRLPFPDNMVPKDSILPRIRRVETCKDTIKRWIMRAE